MRILFMGTPDFAVPILKTLADKKNGHEVVAVVTQPDRPKGRSGRSVTYSAVKECAMELGLPVFQPEKIRTDNDFMDKITAESVPANDRPSSAYEADIFVVVAYGQLLPERILKIPPMGCINIHASLLPKYRGAAPMQRAILNGEPVTGVTIMHMDKGMDTGDMILKKTLDIEPADRFIDLHDKMSALSCECIVEALRLIESGCAQREPQNHEDATYAPMLTKEDGLIDWSGPTSRIMNQVRALDPWPGTYTYHDGQMLKIWACDIWEPDGSFSDTSGIAGDVCISGIDELAGEVLESGKHLLVRTGDGILRVTELQGQGGKRMKAEDYLRGRSIPLGTRL